MCCAFSRGEGGLCGFHLGFSDLEAKHFMLSLFDGYGSMLYCGFMILFGRPLLLSNTELKRGAGFQRLVGEVMGWAYGRKLAMRSHP